jgi:FK506-binding nuclear protein
MQALDAEFFFLRLCGVSCCRMNSTQIPSKMEGAFDSSTGGKKKKKKKKENPIKMQQAAKEENIKTSELMADGEVQQFATPSKGVNKTPKSITEKKLGAKQGTVEKPNKQVWEMPQLAVPVKGNGKTPAKTPMEQRVATKQGTVVKPSKTESSAVKKHSNGLNIEDITMGKSDGKQAKPGKRVSMRYIGKLVSNGKIFDSNIGKKPFDFRLGELQ